MKALLILSLLFTATIANAQELTIKATPAEADLIWKGLRELPVKDVEGLMAKIRQQVGTDYTEGC
jgi:hypothetical protein